MNKRTTENYHSNACLFTAEMLKLPLGVGRFLRRVKIEQKGLLPIYTVSTMDEVMSSRYVWATKVTSSEVIEGKRAAWGVFHRLQAELILLADCKVISEELFKRAVGITDPTDYSYPSCHFITISHKGGKAGNCYYVYDSVIGRADGTPLTERDMVALGRAPGQVHKVTGKAGDMTASVHSEIDSSD